MSAEYIVVCLSPLVPRRIVSHFRFILRFHFSDIHAVFILLFATNVHSQRVHFVSTGCKDLILRGLYISVSVWRQLNMYSRIIKSSTISLMYEGVSKSFRTGRLERELQMVQLFATMCSCIAIL